MAASIRPKNTKELIDKLWFILNNDIPHQFKWLNLQMKFAFGLITIIMGLLGVIISIVLHIAN